MRNNLTHRTSLPPCTALHALLPTQGESPELKQAMQLASAAAAAAAEAQSAADRCQQQVLELRGRQGQAERRLETLWQLQVTSQALAETVNTVGCIDSHGLEGGPQSACCACW